MKLRFGHLGAILMASGLALVALPRPAEATSTRVWTLGGMNRFILDDANRFLYPHMITKYGNLFYLELFGLSDSIGANAPTSLRMRDSGSGARMLSDADFVGVQSTAGGGAILSLTDDLFLSFHLSDFENSTVIAFMQNIVAQGNIVSGDPNSFGGWLTSGRTPPAITAANRKFDTFVGYNIADVVRLGLNISYGSSKYHYTPNANDPDILNGDDTLSRAPDDLGSSEFRFLLSGGIEPMEALAIDAAFGMGFHGLTYLPNQRPDMYIGGGGVELQADVRAMIGVTEWWELVPAISIRSLSLSASDEADFNTGLRFNKTDDTTDRQTSNITDIKQSAFLFDLGVAGHFKPNDIVQFWGAVGMQMQRRAFQYEHLNEDNNDFHRSTPGNGLEYLRDSQSIDAFWYMRLALEARIFSWLDFRGGVVKYLRGDTSRHEQENRQASAENQDNDFSDDQPFFDYFVGVAAHYEGFFLDFQLDPNWFKRGPNFLSGAQGNMFINGSIGYRY